MQKRAVRFAKVATLAAIPLVISWATPTPPVGRSGAPGDTTCSACHGGAGGTGSVVIASTSGMTNYTPGASKHFTVTVTGSGGKAGFELTARPASNLTGGVAGNFVAADTTTQVLCKTGTTCAAGNPQYIRNVAAPATPAVFNFDWTAPSGSENVTLYVAAAVGYGGNSYTAAYTLQAGGVAAPTLTASPASLSFAYQIGGTAPAAQTLAIGGAATTYTVAVSGGTWLSVSPSSGGTSGSASVSVNPAGLAAGSYSGSVTITAAGSTGSPKTVPIALNITVGAPTLTVSPASLSFAYQTGGATPAAQSIAIGGGPLNYRATVSGGAWLSVSPAGGTAPGSVSVSVNTTGMAAGAYNGTVTITVPGAVNGTQVVPVTLTVTNPFPTLQISPQTLSFTCATGNTPPIPYVLQVASSSTPLNYTASPSGGSWLSVVPSSGTTPGALFVSVNPARLAAGTYNASITFTPSNSRGKAQTVPVTLAVTNAGPSACPVTVTTDH